MVTLDRPTVGVGPQPPAIRPYSSADFAWAVELLAATGGRHRVRRGKVVDVALLAGIVAERLGHPAALVTYCRPNPETLEISAIASAPFDDELIRTLIGACIMQRPVKCRRVYTICSNAEFDTQRILQLVGFRLAAARPGAIEIAARTSTAVEQGLGGLPVRDELEYERLFTPA